MRTVPTRVASKTYGTGNNASDDTEREEPEDDDAPETPPDEPRPPRIDDPPAQPDKPVRGSAQRAPAHEGGTVNTGERKERRGFASMSPEKQREIASKGGRAAHEKGTAHE